MNSSRCVGIIEPIVTMIGKIPMAKLPPRAFGRADGRAAHSRSAYCQSSVASQLKYVIEQELGTGCHNASGFGSRVGNLLQESGLQLSKGVSRSLEKYPDKSRLDRRIVLNAVIDRHLHDVRAAAPSNGADTVPEHRQHAPSGNGAQPQFRQDDAASIGHNRTVEQATSSDTSQEQVHAATSGPQLAHDNRTWVGKWVACQHSPPPVSGIALSSAEADGQAWHAGHDRSQQNQPQGMSELHGSATQQIERGAAPGPAAPAPAANGSLDMSSRAAQAEGQVPHSGATAGDSRAAICMHPGGRPGPPLPVRAPRHSVTPEARAPAPATAQVRASMPAAAAALAEPSATAQRQAPGEPPGPERPPAASAAERQEAAGPVPPRTAPPPTTANSNAGAPAAQRSAAGTHETASGPAALASACMPFEAAEPRVWYCCDLFGAGGGSAPGLPFASAPIPVPPTLGARDDTAIALRALQGRSLLQVRMPGCASFAYTLPSLHAEELSEIRALEWRLRAARYDTSRCAPIFWDTEATGLGSSLWWTSRSHHIVQIAAVGGAAAAGGAAPRELNVGVNPFPIPMSEGATDTTGLTTAAVWASPVPPQVGLARFLAFCLDESEAAGGAVPLLVAHNSNFDNGMLLGDAWQAGLHVPPAWRSLCTYRMAKRAAATCCPELAALPGLSLGHLAKHFGSTVDVEELHDALQDARQLPIITDGLHRAGGGAWSVHAVAQELVPSAAGAKTARPFVDSFENICAARHMTMLKKIGAAPPKPRPPPPPPAVPATTARAKGPGKRGRGVELSQAAHLAALDGSSSGDDAGSSDAVAPGCAESVLTEAPLFEGGAADGAAAEGGSRRRPRALEEMLVAQRSALEPDPFLTVTPEDVPDADRLLGADVLGKADLASAWLPFSAPLADSGLPRTTFRAPLLAKLEAAGFATLLDLLRHTPRLERRLHPSVHVEQLEDKVTARGSVLSVGSPQRRPRCAFLSFKVMLDLLADDGTLLPKEFEACIFTGSSFKGTYKLERDADRLRAALGQDSQVVLVGRFKPKKSTQVDEHVFNVTDFNLVESASGLAVGAAAGSAADDAASEGVSGGAGSVSGTADEDALAVYPARRDVKDTDFARIMPKLIAHLQAHADGGPPAADPRAPPPGDFLPQWILDEYDLAPWLDSLAVVHAELGTALPAGARSRARRRLVFNEAVLLSIMMLHHRVALQSAEQDSAEAPVVCDNQELSASAVAALPYELTAAQQRAATEILNDLARPVPMLRLLQGDVGSGKTAVAFIAALAAVASGYQVAVLVPNEVLAAQHERFVAATSARMPPEHRPVVEVLAGKIGVKRRRDVRRRLEAGDVDIVIGTTALNNAEELFSSLGLVIIDEQHRFGVRQRAQLVKKAPDAPPPHVLFMTATPIPRTIAMTLMSHMTTSVIDELPPGRLPVRTELVRVPPGGDVTASNRRKVLQAIEAELAAGGSVFWVFPLVDESEHFQDMVSAHQAYEQVRAEGGELAQHAMVITGQMSGESKAMVLDVFRRGRCRLLLSTVVIEVGIDVPDATLMVVEHAERFGLLQLHQLRGRVGRSDKQSACTLVTTSKGPQERLQVLTETASGHAVALADLQLRGAGQIFGQRQSGPAELGLGALLKATDLAADEEAVLDARRAAAALIREYGFRGLPRPLLAALSVYNMTSLLALKMQDVDIHM
eukprot:jgi/Ulvmu1/10241/UM060_0042.1